MANQKKITATLIILFSILNVANAEELKISRDACNSYLKHMNGITSKQAIKIKNLIEKIENLEKENKFFKGLSEKMWHEELN